MPRPAVARRSALLATVLGTASTIAAPAANAAPDGGRAAGPSRLAAPGRYPATPVPNLATRHLLNRFSYGVTPELRTEAVQAGGAPAWFEKQLNPANIADPVGNAFSSWFPNLWLTPGVAWDLRGDGGDGMVSGALLGADLHRWTMLRRMYSSRQVLEVMVEFWSNVLHVPAPDEKAWPYRVRYDQVIRKNALGRYDDMLVEAVLHPAMLCYLDNAVSSSRDPNENLGREVLECHTVGQESGLITETAVKNSTMILTGYMVDMWETWAPFYSEDDHFTGPVTAVGFTSDNPDPDGRQLAKDYLRHLAHHPATAHRLARRLCLRFVSDNAPDAMVQDIADAYLAADTDISATLRALVRHPGFLSSAGKKVRTPTEDFSATYRTLGAKINQGSGTTGDAVALIPSLLLQIGQQPYNWPRPDGFPDTGDAWASSGRMLGSWRIHFITSGGQSPKNGITYRAPASWVPELPIRFDALVDHLSRVLLGRLSTAVLLDACCKSMGWSATEVIADASHPLIRYKIPALLLTLLDTPEFMTR